MASISKTIYHYYEQLENDPHQRYKSWEHCYSFFRGYRTVEDDLACLHLGFYLASWGMYRGSSFLLQKDYKIHKYALSVLLQSQYESLWDIQIPYSQDTIQQILHLSHEIRRAYIDNIQVVNGNKKQVNVTGTLVTKILLGTMGCVPAFDRYFVSGLKASGLKHYTLNRLSLLELLHFYESNKLEFQDIQKEMTFNGLTYPPMKLLDMYFWEIGFHSEN